MISRQLHKIAATAVVLAGSLFLISCQSVVDTVDGHLTELNSSTDNFRNQSILLNILRSKHGAPLSFVSLPTVATQYNADVSYALPSYQLGPLRIQSGRPFGISNTTFGGDFQNQTQPTFNNLVGKDFNDAVTAPIQRLRLLRFARDGYPIDLLLLLSTSRVEMKIKNVSVVIPNQDLEKPIVCPLPEEGKTKIVDRAECLRIIRSAAMDAGIDLELTETKKIDIIADEKDDSKKTKKTVTEFAAEFCFTSPEPLNANYYASINMMSGPPGKICGSSNSRKSSGIVNVELRSLVGVYRFLGEYLRNPDLWRSMTVKTPRGSDPLLVIVENAGVPCFAEVIYLNKRYCVPDDNSGQTKQVFAILDQLQNINTDISKLPQPSVVTLSGRLR